MSGPEVTGKLAHNRVTVRASSRRSSGLRGVLSRRLSVGSIHDSLDSNKGSQWQLTECNRLIEELNYQTALFRDFLISVGKPNDSPEVRDRIKQVRRKCVDSCSSVSHLLMPQIRSDVAEGIPVDSQHLVNLVCCTQLLLRELRKCNQMISVNAMDMREFYENRPSTSGMAVLDKLVLWRPPHDYHQEEIVSIARDTETILHLLGEMQEYMPKETNYKSLIEESPVTFPTRRKRALYRNIGDLCCLCKSNLS
ncbi:regulator of G-protein signaling 7-binding protein A-like isoform X1 [Tachypleus tridentatus]|uniref:regulator of G-protein signaling 7-binding protein A-like isoform X1 n=1 Tax=Tachypleus tridentatus TaxID=6853 RepID=UPI003FCFD56B